VAENKDILGGDTQVTVARLEDGDIFAFVCKSLGVSGLLPLTHLQVYRENECFCTSLNPRYVRHSYPSLPNIQCSCVCCLSHFLVSKMSMKTLQSREGIQLLGASDMRRARDLQVVITIAISQRLEPVDPTKTNPRYT